MRSPGPKETDGELLLRGAGDATVRRDLTAVVTFTDPQLTFRLGRLPALQPPRVGTLASFQPWP